MARAARGRRQSHYQVLDAPFCLVLLHIPLKSLLRDPILEIYHGKGSEKRRGY
jgi:hypothetical protein